MSFRVPRQVSPVANGTSTEDKAISALQACGSPDVGFVVAVKMRPPPETQRISQESLAEARSNRLDLYVDGVFLDLMRAGGYVILEFDKKTDNAPKLYLVTSDAAGGVVVQSSDVHGDLERAKALATMGRSADFSEALFTSPQSGMDELLAKFGGPGAAEGIRNGRAISHYQNLLGN